jgi:acetyl esterase/lipase
MNKAIFIFLLNFLFVPLIAKESPFPLWKKVEYKIFTTVDKVDLRIYDLPPKVKNKFSDYTVLCFFGGGFVSGSPSSSHASLFNDQGFRVFAPEYRIRKYFKDSTPMDCADDAIAAYEWLVKNAADLKIDKDKIIISGYSAGGLLAGIIPIKTTSNTKPHCVILFSALLNLSPEGYKGKIVDQIKDKWKPYSPLQALEKDYPKCYLFVGGKDTTVKPTQSQEFHDKLIQLKLNSEIFLFPNAGHRPGKEVNEKLLSILDEIIK